LDANRSIGQPDKITVTFGRKITKDYKGELQTVIEDIQLLLVRQGAENLAADYANSLRILPKVAIICLS
jgi:hypothetical protein